SLKIAPPIPAPPAPGPPFEPALAFTPLPPAAEFPLKSVFETVSAPRLRIAPPSAPEVRQLLTVQLCTVSAPLLTMAAAELELEASASVRLRRRFVVPALKVNNCDWLPPLMKVRFVPFPLRV